MKVNVKYLQLLNNSTINAQKIENKSTKRNEIIAKILQDETCFFKMEKDDALSILTDIGIPQRKLTYTYQSLTCEDSYRKIEKNISKNDLVLDVNNMYSVNIFPKEEKNIIPQNTEQTNISLYQEENIFTKLINFIKKIFKKKP